MTEGIGYLFVGLDVLGLVAFEIHRLRTVRDVEEMHRQSFADFKRSESGFATEEASEVITEMTLVNPMSLDQGQRKLGAKESHSEEVQI